MPNSDTKITIQTYVDTETYKEMMAIKNKTGLSYTKMLKNALDEYLPKLKKDLENEIYS